MFASILRYQSAVILDGATGTELEARKVQINDSKLWSAKLLVSDPQVLKDIHADYYRAGADVCTTSSYQVRHARRGAHADNQHDSIMITCCHSEAQYVHGLRPEEILSPTGLYTWIH